MNTPFTPIQLVAPDQASAAITPYGAHVTSWKTPGGREVMFLSERAEFRPGASIRGGVPVCFPQFSGRGPLPNHGFVRTTPWTYTGTTNDTPDTVTAHFQVCDSEETRRIWDYGFQLDLTVTVGGPQCVVRLAVTNTGDRPLAFNAALHTYFHVSDISAVTLTGLEGLAYEEFRVAHVQHDADLRIQGEVDRIYWDVPGPITLHDTTHSLEVAEEGFTDAVVWNPGPERCAVIEDMKPDGYRNMLCIEAAVIREPVQLAPGAQWYGLQRLTISE